MELKPGQSADICKYKTSVSFDSWYDEVFIAKLPESKSQFLVRKAKKMLFPILHKWANLTENQMFSKPHRTQITLEERMKKEFDVGRTWNGGPLSAPIYRPIDHIFIYTINRNISNCRDLVNKGNESEIRSALCKAVQGLEDLHYRGDYHGDALLKNAWLGKSRSNGLSVQWTGMMQNVSGFNIAEMQALDYLNLILSQKKYVKKDWRQITQWVIDEVKGSRDPTTKYVPALLKATNGLAISRRISSKEKADILKALEP